MATFHWKQLLDEVAKKISSQQFSAWMGSIHFQELNAENLVLSVPNSFLKDWLDDHYQDVFREALKGLYGLHVDLAVKIQAAAPALAAIELLPEEAPEAPAALTTPEIQGIITSDQADLPGFEARSQDSERVPVAAISVRDMITPVVKTVGEPLDPKHTFDTFVVGASNQFAHAAARAVAEQPASQYNPLFVYSGAGLGKTHLLHAIGNHILKINPKARICYISAEVFVNEVIECIRHEKMAQLRAKYRNSFDMLLMDDIQFIAGKDRTQEEFFHTFNALHSSKRQIVVTSDKFPKDIPGLEERLRTRFEWGLVADIQPPDIETRIAILKAKAELDDLFLPNDVAVFLASHIKTNVRELEGALLRLDAQSSLSGVEISLELAKRELKNIIEEPSLLITADVILEAVSNHFSIRVADLKGSARSRSIVLPRQIGMFLIRKYCNLSFMEIGLLFGGKDHSTVMHSVKSITKDIASDAEIRAHVEAIQSAL